MPHKSSEVSPNCPLRATCCLLFGCIQTMLYECPMQMSSC